MGDDYPRIRVAAVQAAPVFLNREGTVAKACALIREAASNGARLIGFPEGFIPTHPLWFHFHPASGFRSLQFSKELFKNSVIIPSPATEALCEAARAGSIYVVIGICEKTAGRMGTLYNTLLFIDDKGQIVGRHRKLHPTLGERLVHAPGDAEGLRAYPTEFGAMSGLMCGENSNALSLFVLDAMGTTVHVASWPSHFNHGTHMGSIIEVASRSFAYQAKAFVVNAVGAISAEMREALPANDLDREFLSRSHGGASVIGPWGQFLAGPMEPGEGILYADLSIEEIIIGKSVQDFSGHYNRFDVFSLTVRPGAARPLCRLADPYSKNLAQVALEGRAESLELTSGTEDPLSRKNLIGEGRRQAQDWP
ncbi:MAG TPA: carbon-nitrogen hydrolase family protein [bacterium]|nr:carbon-nitrogen hydrolase family protein [bacterium]